jgi:hypothetical protein
MRRSQVDQHPSASRPLEEDRIALAHIEHRDVQPTVRAAAVDDDQQQAQAD